MPTARKVRVIDELQLWPGSDLVMYEMSPPLDERDMHGNIVESHRYVAVYIQPQFMEFQHAKAVMVAVDDKGLPKGTQIKPISEVMQGPWNPSLAGLFYVNGYTVEES